MAVPDKCRGCGYDLIYHAWNSDVDVAVCDNDYCRFFRNPIPVAIGTHELITTRKPLKRAGKGRWEFGDEEEEGESQRAMEELRKMRRALLGKEERPEIL